MARLLRMTILMGCLLAARDVLAATYYVDYASGSDSNNGTSKTTPWQHAPGMQTCVATCGSAKINAGDSVILKGGVTWPNSSFRWVLPSGSSGNPTYIGVDKTWYAGSSWARPILNPGGQVIANNYNELIYINANTTFDNFEVTGYYWTSASFAGNPFGNGVMIYMGQNNGQTVENLYIHGWTHAGTSTSTNNGVICIFATGGGYNSVAHDNVIVGTDVPGDHSVNVFFNGPATAYNNYIKQVSSAFIVSYGTSYHDNHIEDIGPAYCNVPTAGYCTHENGFEDNGDLDLYFYNNTVTNVTGGLALWIAPNPGHTAYVWNNVVYSIHDNQVIDLAQPVYNATYCSTGESGQGYCNNLGTFVMYNNTVECGDDTTRYDFCGSNWGSTANNAGLVFKNNHFIDNTSASGCASGAVNCTFAASNIVESLSQANAQGYSSGQIFAFIPTSSSGTGSDLLVTGKGENLSTVATGSLASLMNDTAYGIGYNAVFHTVVVPARATNPRPQGTGTSWDSGAYYMSGGAVAPPQGLATTITTVN
jgi:hypothetical protein